MKNTINKILFFIFIAIVLYTCFGCSEEDCKTGYAQFYNLETSEYIYQETDCNKAAPDGYVFVKWVEPEY